MFELGKLRVEGLQCYASSLTKALQSSSLKCFKMSTIENVDDGVRAEMTERGRREQSLRETEKGF